LIAVNVSCDAARFHAAARDGGAITVFRAARHGALDPGAFFATLVVLNGSNSSDIAFAG